MVDKGVGHPHERRDLGVRLKVKGSGKPSQAAAGEWSLSPQTHRPTVDGLIPSCVRYSHPLIDPIHLPSSRRVETPVVHFDSLTGTFYPYSDDIGLHHNGPDLQGPYNPCS